MAFTAASMRIGSTPSVVSLGLALKNMSAMGWVIIALINRQGAGRDQGLPGARGLDMYGQRQYQIEKNQR